MFFFAYELCHRSNLLHLPHNSPFTSFLLCYRVGARVTRVHFNESGTKVAAAGDTGYMCLWALDRTDFNSTLMFGEPLTNEVLYPYQVRDLLYPHQVRDSIYPYQVRDLLYPHQVREVMYPY